MNNTERLAKIGNPATRLISKGCEKTNDGTVYRKRTLNDILLYIYSGARDVDLHIRLQTLSYQEDQGEFDLIKLLCTGLMSRIV